MQIINLSEDLAHCFGQGCDAENKIGLFCYAVLDLNESSIDDNNYYEQKRDEREDRDNAPLLVEVNDKTTNGNNS